MNEMLEINIVVFSNTFRFQFTIYRINIGEKERLKFVKIKLTF